MTKLLPGVRSFSELTTPAVDAWPLYEDVETRGVEYRLEGLLAYAKGLKDALESNEPFGVRILHEPDNEYDPLAMKVVGWWRGHEQHLGYLPARMAYACRHLHKDKTISARLVDLVLDIDRPRVLIDVLQIG